MITMPSHAMAMKKMQKANASCQRCQRRESRRPRARRPLDESSLGCAGPYLRHDPSLGRSEQPIVSRPQKGDTMRPPAAAMKALLDQPALQIMPGCGDGMGARLIEEA